MAEYNLIRLLDENQRFSRYLAEKTDGSKYLVKQFSHSIPLPDAPNWKRECVLMQQLHHPQIPQYIDHYVQRVENQKRPHLVLEWIQGSTLKKYIENHRVLRADVVAWIEQILHVLMYLQSLKELMISLVTVVIRSRIPR